MSATDHAPPKPISHSAVSRRKFLGQAAASAADLLLVPSSRFSDVLAYGHIPSIQRQQPVALTQVDLYDQLMIKQRVEHLFDSIGGITDVVKAGSKFAIKINLTGGSGSAYSSKLGGKPITESMWTHPEVLRAVGEPILDCGVIPNRMRRALHALA